MKRSRSRREALQGVEENARIKRGNDAVVRVCIIGFGLAIVAIVPVPWGWKIVLFLAIMLFVGILMPAVRRARRRPF
jgi:Flp pilus assembly protein TadB